jgi:hypothetical protein
MRSITSLITAITILSASISVAGPIMCQDAASKYQLMAMQRAKMAILLIDKRMAPHGTLKCGTDQDAEEIFLSCKSQRVVDAGYIATFRRGTEAKKSTATLEEQTIAGPRLLASLTCTEMGGDEEDEE